MSTAERFEGNESARSLEGSWRGRRPWSSPWIREFCPGGVLTEAGFEVWGWSPYTEGIRVYYCRFESFMRHTCGYLEARIEKIVGHFRSLTAAWHTLDSYWFSAEVEVPLGLVANCRVWTARKRHSKRLTRTTRWNNWSRSGGCYPCIAGICWRDAALHGWIFRRTQGLSQLCKNKIITCISKVFN